MLSVTPIARVVVNAVRASASQSSFDTGLLLIRDAKFSASRCLASCDSSAAALSQLASWGFDPQWSQRRYGRRRSLSVEKRFPQMSPEKYF